MSSTDALNEIRDIRVHNRHQLYVIVGAIAVCLTTAIVSTLFLLSQSTSQQHSIDSLSSALAAQRAQFAVCKEKMPNDPSCLTPVAPPPSAVVKQGPTGAPGPQGPQGIPGADGTTGPAGAPGPAGPTGKPGVTATGPAGPQGPPGVDGTNGSDGKNGNNGTDGKDGSDGKNGASGPQGPAGPAGTDTYPFTFSFKIPGAPGHVARTYRCVITSPTTVAICF